jgi:inosine-uridine nucleoside N-ribohydrolase
MPQLKSTRSQLFQSFSTFLRPQQSIVFVDTDAGFDDVLAISSIINTKSANVPFISTVGGIQDNPERASQFLSKMYPSTNVVMAGFPQKPVDKVPSWLLEFRRKLDDIMTSMNVIAIDETLASQEIQSKMQLAVQNSLQKYPDKSIDLFCLGPLTNVASWIKDENTLSLLDCKLKSIWIMGGNTPDMDEHVEAEFNFAQDPKAVKTVLTSPILKERINLVTAQACSKNVIDAADWNEIVEKGKKSQGILSKVFEVESSWDNLKYDPVSAFVLAHSTSSDIVSMKAMELKVDEQTGLLISSEGNHVEDVSINLVDEVKIGSEFLSFMTNTIANDPELV